jgi:hypothetical protein
MQLRPHHRRVWEKLKYQLSVCFNSSSRRMSSRIIVAQKKLFLSNPTRILRIADFNFDFRRFNALRPPKKRITARCSTTAQFESCVANF